jgi:hypothetical protein
MGYDLQAVIAGGALIDELAGRFKLAVQVPLVQGLALIPATSEWIGEVGKGELAQLRPFVEFETLTSPVAQLLVAASSSGPVAYIEYFEFGNDSGEVAAVWSSGRLILPPTELSPGAVHGPGGGPILMALKMLGAEVDPHRDAIDSFGLTQFHKTSEWTQRP